MIFSFDDLQRRFPQCTINGHVHSRFSENARLMIAQFVEGPIELRTRYRKSFHQSDEWDAEVKFLQFPCHTSEMMDQVGALLRMTATQWTTDLYVGRTKSIAVSETDLVQFPQSLDGQASFYARKLDVMALMGAIDCISLETIPAPPFMVAQWSKAQLSDNVLGGIERTRAKM